MGLGETVIVAGIGCRKDVATDDVLAALDAALAAHGRSRGEVVALATVEHKRDEQAVIAAAKALGLPLRVVASHHGRSETDAAWVPDTSAALRFRDDGGVVGLPLPSAKSKTNRASSRKAERSEACPGPMPMMPTDGRVIVSAKQSQTGSAAAWVPDTSAALRFRDDGGGDGLPDDGGVETITRSERSLAVAGVASVSEHAALAAAGDGARLLGPRTALGHVTCALAEVAP